MKVLRYFYAFFRFGVYGGFLERKGGDENVKNAGNRHLRVSAKRGFRSFADLGTR
jgi:hypothetical protein